ncbi:MAG: helix-hairpin-helix domain-containing protein, partial [Clostridia bacterium]|nr:helix-hairpin-helix domain-containing protein [Clostridia bacterium]
MRRSFLSAMCAIVLLCAALLFVRGGGALRRAIVLPAEQSAGLPPLIRETPRFLPLPPERERLNLNTAAKEELSSLPGIGPTLAGRIVDYRDAHGP